MNTRQDILEANDAGNVLETIVATPYEQVESVARTLSDLHNLGEIDFLAYFETPPLAAIPERSIPSLQRFFCQTLPNIDCSAEAAETACRNMFDRAGSNEAAGLVYGSLSEWFRQSPARADEGLALIHRDPDTHRRIVRPVLLAGAIHDAGKYVEEAFNLMNDPRSPVRLDALWTLGQIVPAESERLLARTIQRFNEIIGAPNSDQDTAAIVEAAAGLLHRTAGRSVNAVEPLFEKVSSNQTPLTRHALATALLRHRRLYSEAMIDATLAALQHTDRRDIHTSKTIDCILYQSDLDADRTRVLDFLVNLFTQGDDALDLETLSDFRHQLRDQPGDVLGWYIVSLLLTGDHALCTAAERLLPYKETPDGLDIDLSPFSLTPSWILYLARKILGYCLLNKESAAALLLSCLRAVPERNRTELEALVLNHFFMNYLTAIGWLESAISDDDHAKQSVNRLSSQLRVYVAELEQYGICPAFRPSERERQLQGHRQADFQRDVHKQAEQGSLLSALAHKATVLYGTSGIIYVHRDAASEPVRQEISMGTFGHFLEFPRFEAIDPVGLQYNIRLFRSEEPPRS